MHTGYHTGIGAAASLPINATRPVISFSPIVLPSPQRPVPLEIRATVPSTGDALPILLLSHGQGRSNSLSSLEGCAPVAEFWAAHGFAVLQPTHLSSAFLGLTAPKGQEMFYQERCADLVCVLDNLDAIEATVPGLAGRLDRARVALAGHSAGAITTCMMLGMTNTDPRDGFEFHRPESRIRAGVVLAGTGAGGEGNVTEAGMAIVPFYGPDFGTMKGPALVVYGDQDAIPQLTTRGADWHGDPYTLAPGPKDLLVLKGGHHGLGGVSGWDAGESQDESPERLGIVQRMTWAYLMSQLYEGDTSWADACKAFAKLEEHGSVESKA